MSSISYQRLEEIASRAIDRIIELDLDGVEEWLESELDMTEKERQYFCVDDNIRETAQAYVYYVDEDDEDEEEENDEYYD